MVYAGILAAGAGARMHRQDLPKPFLPLGDKPIMLHTLEQFLINPGVDRVILVVPDDWLLYARDLMNGGDGMGKETYIIGGGVNKTESIHWLVRYIATTWGIKDGDLLILHDAVRPFVTQRLIDENIAAALDGGAANTVMRMNDTVVVSRDGARLDEVPAHEIHYAQQTPQTYALPLLKEAIDRAVAGGVALRDETELPRLYIRMGYEMRLVHGEYFNMKIINPYDLEVAEALLKERST